jgi:two-component system, NarL family, response regulator LiaR
VVVNLKVWVHSQYAIIAEAMLLLVTQLGHEGRTMLEPDTDVALWDLTATKPPYPPATSLPTLGLIAGHDLEAVSLLRQHYRGYLTPTHNSRILKEALEAVRRGEIWADRKILTDVIDQFDSPHLTKKEEEIFNLLTQGLSNRAIAKELNIVEGTVKMHISRIFSKMNVSKRSELIAQYFKR